MEDTSTQTLSSVIAELLPPIDEALAERGEPLRQRPHKAATLVVEHCIIDIKGDSKDGYLTKPWFGSILAATIDWYDKIYGKALRVNTGFTHTAAVLIRHTPFLLQVPLSSFTPKSSDNTFWIKILASVQSDEAPLSWVQYPPNFAELSGDQLALITQEIRKTAENARVISNTLLTVDHVSENARRHSTLVLPHLESTAKLIAKHDPLALSSAIWEANFAAEQAVKSYLTQVKSPKAPKTHDIKILHQLAIWDTPHPQSLIDSIALMPSGADAVRYRYYELTSPTLSRVMELYEASQIICRHYVEALP